MPRKELKIVSFDPRDLLMLNLQDDQDHIKPLLSNPSYGGTLVESGPAFSGYSDGKPVACIGVHQIEDHKGCAWALMSKNSGPYMFAITRHVKAFLDSCGLMRVEAGVSVDFELAIRWAEILGFKQEGRMTKYFPDGSDAYLYARV